jgi:hypothetical protein
VFGKKSVKVPFMKRGFYVNFHLSVFFLRLCYNKNMSALEISQIIFNLVISVAAIVAAVLFSMIAYNIIRFSKSVKIFIDDVDKESSVLYQKINKFLESIFTLSFVSKFFKKKIKKNNSK